MAYDPIIYGGSKSAVKGYSSARSKYFDELEKEKEKKAKETVAFGDTSNKASTVEQSKGFFGGVGDFLGGVAKTVGEGVQGAGEFAVETVKGVGNIIDNEGKLKKEEEFQKNKQEYLKQFLGDEEKYLAESKKYSEEHAADRGNIDWAKQKEDEAKFKEAGQKTYKLAQYIPGVSLGVEGAGTVAAAIAGEDSDINKKLIELTQSKDWDKLSDEEKKQALIQRNIGGALSTLDLLPLSGKTVGTGVKATVKGGVKEGLKAAGKEFTESVGSKTIKEVASVGAKELAKQTAKSTATGTVMGAGLGVGLNALMGGSDWQQAAMEGAKGGFIGGFIGSPLDVDVKSVLKQSGKNSLDVPDETLDAIIKDIDATKAKGAEDAAYIASRKAEFEQIKANRAAGLNDDGSRIINLDTTNQQLQDLQNGKYSDDLYDVTTPEGKAAEPEYIQAATQKQVDALTARRDEIAKQVDSIESPAAREMAMQNVNKIDDQIAAITSGDTKALMDTGDTGLSRTLNTEKVRAKFNQLQNDLAEGNFRQRAEMDAAAKRNAPTRTYDSVSNDLDALGAGGVAPEAVTPRADFVNIDEVVRHPNIPEPIKRRAMSLSRDRTLLQQQLDNVMTPQKANAALDEMDAKFNQDMERIDMMPEPRRTAEAERVQSEYENAYNQVQDKLAADRDVVNQLSRVEEQINANMDEVLADSNIIKDSNPTEFGKVDQELNAKVSKEIEEEAETAMFNRMSKEEGIPDSENVSKAWTESPDNISEYVDSPEVKNLVKESLNDTFRNERVDELRGNIKDSAINASYVGSSWSSPNVVLEKAFDNEGKMIYGRLIDGYGQNNKANLYDAKKLTSVKKLLGGDKVLYSKVVDVLEGKDVDISTLNNSQKEAIDIMRDFYEQKGRLVRKLAYMDAEFSFKKRLSDGDIKFTESEIASLAKRDNITLKAAKEKYGNIDSFSKKDIDYIASQHAEKSTLDNYHPHIFDKNGKETSSFDMQYAKVNGNIKFGNLLHRTLDGDDYSRDLIDVAVKYTAALNKKLYLEPGLRELDDAKFAIKAAGYDSKPIMKWLDKYQEQVKFNSPDKIGEGWNELVDKVLTSKNPNNPNIGQNHYRKMLSTQRQINSWANLGLSFRNGIQQFTQMGTAIGTIGSENFIPGVIKYLKQKVNPVTSKAYTDLLGEHGITNAGIAQEAFSDLADTGLGGMVKSKTEAMSNILMKMSSVVDEFVRGSTYEGSLIENLKNGMNTKDARILATATAAKANFLTNKVDMPIKLNSDTARSLSQFMTFSYKQAEAWKNLGMKVLPSKVNGQWQLHPKEMQRFTQMLIFYGVAFEGMSQLAGINPEDNIPFYGNIFGDSGLPKSPLVSLVFGRDENNPGIPELLMSLANPEGESDFEKEENRNETLEKFGNLMIKNFVPAGSQGVKSYEGFQSTQNDGVVSKDGKVKFIQNTDESSKLKASLFGKYSTEAGREWINKKFPTLSEKQSEILNKQKDAESKQKAYDFYSGLKSADMKNNVTPEIKEIMKTRPNRAQTMIEEHNSSVKKAVEAYISKYGELSDYEKEYLKDNYYITVKNVENLSED